VNSVAERYVEDPRYWILGYEDEGTLLGAVTVSFRWTLFRGGEVAIIEDLVVDTGHRGEGIGAALVRFVEDKIVQETGVRAIEVHSDFHREEAHTFWESIGYCRLAFQFRKETG
jgi:GNAT superfamily N-acetyltransferase